MYLSAYDDDDKLNYVLVWLNNTTEQNHCQKFSTSQSLIILSKKHTSENTHKSNQNLDWASIVRAIPLRYGTMTV